MEKKFIHGIEVRRDGDGRWLDEHGTEYALPDEASMVDRVTRCGVGIAEPAGRQRVHAGVRRPRNLYSDPAYQASNPRSRADRVLLDQLLIVAGKNPFKRAAAYAMYYAARLFGRKFWEDPGTRDL